MIHFFLNIFTTFNIFSFESKHIKKNVDVTTEKIENKYYDKIEITFIRNREKEK